MDRADYEKRLVELHARGMRSTMARVLAQYVARFSEPDARFDALYVEGLFRTGTSPVPLRRRDRFRRLLHEFESTLELAGRIAECGCFRGLSSYLLCMRLRERQAGFDGLEYEIYDSFEGLSRPQPEDAPGPDADPLVVRAMKHRMFAFPLDGVRRALAEFPRISYGVGWIPDAFPAEERSYRFVHVDVDLYQPTKASLEHFWPRLVPGGVIVCDDYNWGGARRAVDEFAVTAGATPLATATMQAVLRKP
jgi:hypothetical protein